MVLTMSGSKGQEYPSQPIGSPSILFNYLNHNALSTISKEHYFLSDPLLSHFQGNIHHLGKSSLAFFC